jgi:hypothetical protein
MNDDINEELDDGKDGVELMSVENKSMEERWVSKYSENDLGRRKRIDLRRRGIII